MNTAVLVLSCDKYSDIWPTFFDFFFKYWPNCPFPVYLGTNKLKFEHENVIQLFSKRETTWSEELEVILSQIKEEYILIILEDYFIYEKVNNEEVIKCVNALTKMDGAYMKLACFPKQYDSLWPYQPLKNQSLFGVIAKGSQYRICLQTAIWNKAILLQLLNPSENPWQFEIEGSKRSNKLEKPFLCVIADPTKKHVHGPITYFCTALSAGKWMRGAIKLCKENNIKINSNDRPIESRLAAIKRYIYIASPLKIRRILNFVASRLS